MIYILHDVKSSQLLGGAALTCESLGKLPGALDKTTVITAKEFTRELVRDKFLIVGRIETFNPDDLKWIAETQSFVKIEFDYGFCQYQHAMDHDCWERCSPRFPSYQRLIDSAVLNIYSSPGHLAIHNKHLDIKKAFVWPRPIDVEMFWSDNIEDRNDCYITVGEHSPHKGFPETKKLFPQLVTLRNTPPRDVATRFKGSKYFVSLPRWYEPFGRAVAEAYLAGCTMLVNPDKIGLYSYPWNFDDREEVAEYLIAARYQFWSRVSDVW